jgi:RNA polymerase sigma-70 factor (ECF subfamily)
MDLTERFAAGDLEAFEALFRQYQEEVFRWILRIIRNSAEAEDLTVEAFWRAYRAHARFRPGVGSFGGWLRRIATNLAIDQLRRRRAEVPLPDDLGISPPHPGEQVELRRHILHALSRLSPRLRGTVLLALVEEVPYEEIAQALGISVSAVKLRVFRGVRILRRELAKAGVHP